MDVVTLRAVDRFHTLVCALFKDGGRLDEALRVCELRLGREERACGAESVEAAACLCSMALVYAEQGDYAKALEYHQKDLDIILKALGPAHPSVGATFNNNQKHN